MTNFDTAREALVTSLKSPGSALAEHAKWSESVEAHINSLKASWQALSQTFMDSDGLKVAIDMLSGLVDIIEKLVDKLGLFGTIGLGSSIYSIFKLKGTGVKTSIFGALSEFTSSVPQILASKQSLVGAFKDIGKSAKSAGGTITKSLTGSLSGWVTGVGLAVAAIGLIVTAIKNYKEEISAARQETIETANKYLEASSSFEVAYAKYAGKTDLTAQEEEELESAIRGTVDALGDKSSKLQSVVNSSNDYVKSLEQIKKAELEERERQAKQKRDAALNELEDMSGLSTKIMMGVPKSNIAIEMPDEDGEAAQIAQRYLSDYWQSTMVGGKFKKYMVDISDDADVDDIVEYYYSLLEYQDKLSSSGLGDTADFERVNAVTQAMSENIKEYTDALYDTAKAQYQLSEGIPRTTEEYLNMREAILSSEDIAVLSLDAKKSFANMLDEEYGAVFDLSTAEVQAKKLIGLLDGYGDAEATQVETFLNMRTKVNNNECTVGEYMSQFNEIKELGESFEEEQEFMSAFGLDTDSIKEQYEGIKDYLWDKIPDGSDEQQYKKDINKFLNDLTASELAAVLQLKTEIDWENASPEQIRAQIEEEARLIEAISFSVNLEFETSQLEALTTAISESVSGAGLSDISISAVEDMFGDLDSYDSTKLFERTANGIRLNNEELRKLNDEYKNANIDGLEEKMDALAERYYQTQDELSDLTYGTEEYNDKLRELDGIEDQINATEQLASQYKGLASAYQTWQMVESSGSQRDMYESMLEGLENVDDEISRGWLDDGTIEFLRLIKGENISATATTKELVSAYESLDDTIKYLGEDGKILEDTGYSIRDFFTVDEDGNSTNTGVYNFLDTIGRLEEEAFGGLDVVKRDDKGNIIGFDFQIAGGDKAIADALGISEELVQIMVRAADDAGFVVSMDGTYQQLDTLKSKAQEAGNTLNELKITDFEFDINTGNKDSVLSQYQEALTIWEEFKKNKNSDGTVNMSVEGAEEAFTLVSTLQSMVDRLAEPAYMQIDSTQVEKSMQTPLSKLQEYERLTQQEHQLQLKGTDTSEIDKTQEEILDYFEGLDPEIKADLGIENLDRDEIQAKLEAGEISIPATVDIQVEMNNTLRDMVNVALYNAGLIDEEELKKRVDVEVYAEEINTDNVVEETEKATEDAFESEGKDPLLMQRALNTEIIVESVGLDNVEETMSKLEGLDDETIQVLAEVLGQSDVEKLKDTMSKLQPVQVEAIAKAIGEGDVEGLKTAISSLSPTYVQAIAEAFGYNDVNDLYTAIENLDPKTVQAVADVLGITDVENLTGAINNVEGKDVEVSATTSGESKLSTLKNIIDGIKSKTVTITSWFKEISSSGSTRNDSNGFSDVNGTANSNGSAFVNGSTGRAFKQGDWRTKKTETALTGELGREIVVTGNRWYTVGDHGAEFTTIPKGSIVFNHRQTEELLRNGKVTSNGGRGRAYGGGSIGTGGVGILSRYIDADVITDVVEKAVKDSKPKTGKGSTGSGGTGSAGGKSSSSKSKSSSSKSSSSSKDEKEFEEIFDLIEIAIQRIEREIDRLDQKANRTYKSWSSRNTALTSEISKVGDEIALQQKAYDRYMEEAAGTGLSSEWAAKVRNGEVDIETIKDEDLAEKIKDYQKWYELALDSQDAIEDLKDKEAELYKQRFDNIQSRYDGILQGYEHTETMLNEYISQAEEQGHIVSKKYYNALISNEKQNISQLKKGQSALIAARDEAVASGKIEKYSQDWYDMCNEIDGVTQAIEESTTALLEYDNAIRDIDWSTFDLIQERISDITAESEFLIELMSNDKLFDDKGKLTSQGAATMGLRALNYNASMYQSDEYGKEIAKLDKQIAKDPYDQELVNRRRELVELQRESILAAEDEKQAIKDLISEGIGLELDALSELIDKKNESLEAEKELYEYQKKVSEQTENIASLRKQMAAYENDDSEEAKAKIQELRVSLQDAETELKETEWDKYIDDTSALLDTLYTDYETTLNTRLDNVDFLLQQVIDGVNAASTLSAEQSSNLLASLGAEGTLASALGVEGAIASAIVNAMGENGSIKNILNKEVTAVGTKLSTAMNNIWSVGDGNIKSVLTTYGQGFQNKQTTTNQTLNSIKISVDKMVAASNKEAEKKTTANKTSTSAKKDPTKISTTTKEKVATAAKKATTTNKSSGDGKAKVGDKVKFVSGKYYYDSEGTKPLGSKNLGKQVYITSINTKSWATHPYHISTGKKLGSGDLGWLKLNQISGYASGKKKISDNEIAWTQENGQEFIIRPSDGAILTPVAKGDSVLNATASGNIWSMANNPAEFIKNNLGLDSANIPNSASVNNSIVQNFENITFSMPNVHNYDETIKQMQRDKSFEKLILAMTLDQVAGKSSLAKGKSIR